MHNSTYKPNDSEKTIIRLLDSGNPTQILSAIEIIRNEGTIMVFSRLIKILSTTTNAEVEKSIINCIADSKNSQALPIIINALHDDSFSSHKAKLLNALWQSSFDLCPYKEVFVPYLFNSYEIAMEALTIIEIIADSLDNNDKTSYKELITKALQNNLNSDFKIFAQQAVQLLS